MTRLLYIAACVTGCLAYTQRSHLKRHDHTGDGYSGSGYNGGNAEVIDITYDVVPKGQDGSAPVQNVAAPMTSGMKYVVTVGGDAGKVFTPNTLVAAVGDMIHFQFLSKNHTATQSTFAKPCERMEGGADSGFKPNPNNSLSPAPSWIYEVKDIKPTWFYCRAKGHCGAGMTFSINPTANKTQAQFMELAKQQNGTVTAGSGGSGSYSAPPTAASASPVAASAPSLANLAAPPPAQTGSVISGGAGGQCACSCLCGTAAFPAGAGIGMYGGMPGAVPAS